MRQILLIAAGLSLVVMTGCNKAPAPEAVCEHVGEILGQEFSEEEIAECVDDMIGEVEEDCGDKTNEALRCVMDAEDRAGLEACEEICNDEE